MIPGSHPILTCAAAQAFEARLFGGDESKEWPAMQSAGRAIATALVRDYGEMGAIPIDARILVLAGKGHNAGDALIAAHDLAERFPQAAIDVDLFFGQRALRPLAARAWRELTGAGGTRVNTVSVAHLANGTAYDACLDGVFGFQFRPPADARVSELLAKVNSFPIRLRAAVDLPSAGLFNADFTYAAGTVKSPAIESSRSGRIRYLDLGFFGADEPGATRVLTADILEPLVRLRSPLTDKRTFGHLFVVGGSRSFPGAVLMTVLAALRSGAGLVTAFVPESLVGAFAARAPEAMWVGWPEGPSGGLALEGEHLLTERLARATALVVGPGLGREPETMALVQSIVKRAEVPLVLDADALQPDIVRVGAAPRILTPHAGELSRIREGLTMGENTVIVHKGPLTRIEPGHAETEDAAERVSYYSLFGGPVLARGGSGDLLAGLIGGLLAQAPREPLISAARGVVWHGLAADSLARSHGQVAVNTTQLLDHLASALREVAGRQY